ncbi:MAG: ATP-binding protein [Chloroflexi bacterium]|nr:ATP-binding protein [Chloroflexota bacterium]
MAAAEAIPALVDIDLMVTRHSAIVGTTGSGKSTTVVGLLAALSDSKRYPSARILIIDIHGEYGHALSDRAAIFRTTPDEARGEKPLYIPYWAMTLEELLPLTLGDLEGSDRGAVVDRITDLKRASLRLTPRSGVTLDGLNVDTPVPFSLHRLWFDLHCEMHATHIAVPGQPQSRQTWALQEDQEGNVIEPGDAMQCRPPRFRPVKDVRNDPEKIRLSASRLNIGRAVDGLGSKLRDPRLAFLFRPGPHLPQLNGTVKSDLDCLLASWLGDERPVTILDLSGVSPAIQSELVGTLLRIVYDALFWARNLPEGGRERPLLVVLEEAHTYLGDGRRGSASSAIQRIAKEGRKYGIGIMLVSQRPSEIDATILSQCGTIFALRLTNERDRSHVRTSASDSLEGIFAMLPVLRTGEAIVVGESVNLPIRTLIERPSARRRPDSADPAVVVAGSEEHGYETPGGWNQRRDPSDYTEVVELWRRQDPHSTRVVADEEREDGEEGK